MPGKLGDKSFGICLSLLGVDIKLFADATADNFPQRSATVGRLKDRGCDLVQCEKRRISRVHDHHFASQRASGDGGTARNVSGILRHAQPPPGSCGRNFALGPKPWSQDRTAGGELEPGRRNHKPWREAFPPRVCLRRRTEYCASGDARLPPRVGRRRGFPDPAPGKTGQQPGRASSPAKGVTYAAYPSALGRRYEISSVRRAMSAGASRVIVVLPAPDTPEN